MKKRFPLDWPLGWARTAPEHRREGKFHTMRQTEGESPWRRKASATIAEAVQRLVNEMQRLGLNGTEFVLSTNNPQNAGGWPRGDREPLDPGVAVYWLEGESESEHCMAIDVYDSLAQNIAAVAATLGHMRGIERHGGATIMKRAFIGLKQLPASTVPTMNTEQAALAIMRLAGFPQSTLFKDDMDSAREYVRIAVARTHPDVRRGDQADFLLAQECKRILEAHFGAKL